MKHDLFSYKPWSWRKEEKKAFCRQFLYPWLLLLVYVCLDFFFSPSAFKDMSSGRNEGCHSTNLGGGGVSGCVGQLNHLLWGGWASVFFCLYSVFLFSFFRCSALTPVLWVCEPWTTHTHTHPLTLCLPACLPSVPLTCLYLLHIVHFPCVRNVCVSLLSICIVWCKCVDDMGNTHTHTNMSWKEECR